MRYLPLNSEDRADMLARVGVKAIEALFADIPEAKRLGHDLDLPHRKTEKWTWSGCSLGSGQKMWRRALCHFLLEQGPTSIMFPRVSII